jgi:hypothetical protein
MGGSGLLHHLLVGRLTHEVRKCIHCECIIQADRLVAHFLWREAHNAFVEELLWVVTRNSRPGYEAADVRLRSVRSGIVTERLICLLTRTQKTTIPQYVYVQPISSPRSNFL